MICIWHCFDCEMGLSQHKSPKSFTSLYAYAFSRTISDVLCTFKRFHNLIFHQSARWVYLGPGVKVGSLLWSLLMTIVLLIHFVDKELHIVYINKCHCNLTN